MEEQRKVPQIRFKGFTDDWEQRKLKDISSYRRGSFPQPYGKEEWYGGSQAMPFVQVADVNDDLKLNEETKQTISKLAQPMSVYIPKESVIVTLQGTIGKVAITQYNTYLDRTILYFDTYKIGNINKYFWALTIKNKFEEERKKAPGAVIKTITKEVLSEFNLNIPQQDEQEKIGMLFANIDNLITLHQRKCDKLVEVKKSLLEKMFPKNSSKIPEIRFKGFTDDWEQRKLNDFGIATGGTSIESEFSNNGKYKVISIGSYSENSNYNDQGIRAIYSDKTKLRVLNKEDLTMILNDKTASGRIIGRVLYIDKSGEYVYNQRTERIEINKELYKSRFIYHLLNAPEMRNKIIKQSQGNTQIFVNWNSIKNTEYLVPNLNEQNQLEKIFDSIDNLITLHQRKLEKLKEVKKSMLEKMFV